MSTNETWTIGELVRKIRTDQGVTLQELSRGLCSAATLSRIEADERDMDMMMADAVFGRLGYSPDKFEIYTGPEELERYNLREQVIREKGESEIPSLKRDMQQYYDRYGKKLSALEEQFLKEMEGFLAWKAGCLEEAERLIEEAVQITIPAEGDAWIRQAVLSEREMQLLVMLSDIYQGKGRKTDAFRLIDQIFRHLDGSERRKEQMTDLYVQVAGKLTSMYFSYGETEHAYEACKKALELLKKTKKHRNLPEMMEWKGKCEEQLEQEGRLAKGFSRGSNIRAYYLYLAMEKQEEAGRVKAHMEELGQLICINEYE